MCDCFSSSDTGSGLSFCPSIFPLLYLGPAAVYVPVLVARYPLGLVSVLERYRGMQGRHTLGWPGVMARLCVSAFCLETVVAETALLPLHVHSLLCSLSCSLSFTVCNMLISQAGLFRVSKDQETVTLLFFPPSCLLGNKGCFSQRLALSLSAPE